MFYVRKKYVTNQKVPHCEMCGYWFYGCNIDSIKGKMNHYCMSPERGYVLRMSKQKTSPQCCPIRKRLNKLKNANKEN